MNPKANKRINTKAKGNRAERKAKASLEDTGHLVTKSSASLGAFDLIAENPLGVRHIQVKCNENPGSEEKENMLALRNQLPKNSTIEYWVYYDGNKKPKVVYM